MITFTKPSVSPVKSAATDKVDLVRQALFNQDIFMCLIDHLTVKECYAMFAGLSKWHHSFLNGERTDIEYLRGWVRTNHGLSAMISPDCRRNEDISGSFHGLVDDLFEEVKRAQLSTDYFSVSTMLRHLYDGTLEIPDRKKNPEMSTAVKCIHTFQAATLKVLKGECTNILARMRLLIDSKTEKFNVFDPPHFHLIEIVKEPPLFGAHDSDSLVLMNKASGMLCKLVTKFPRKSLRLELILYTPAIEPPKERHKLGILEAFVIGFNRLDSRVTRDNCASGLLRLLAVMQDEFPKTKQILDDDFIGELVKDIKKYGCVAFPATLKAFRVFCQRRNPAVCDSIVRDLIRFCEAAMKNVVRLGQKQFRIITDCVYGLVCNYLKGRVRMFVRSQLFKLISKYIKERRPTNPKIPIRVLSILLLIRKHGTDETFRGIVELFPVSNIIKHAMQSGFHPQSLSLVSCLPSLLLDVEILDHFFEDVRLVEQLINVGIASLNCSEEDLNMAESVLNCVKNIIHAGGIPHILILIKNTRVWVLFSKCAESQRRQIMPVMMKCVSKLLLMIELSENDCRLRLSYAEAKRICKKEKISKGIIEYCKKETVRKSEFPQLLRHFPALSRYILYD